MTDFSTRPLLRALVLSAAGLAVAVGLALQGVGKAVDDAVSWGVR